MNTKHFLTTIWFAIAAALLSACGSGSGTSENSIGTMALEFEGASAIGSGELDSIKSSPMVQSYLDGKYENTDSVQLAVQALETQTTSLSDYATVLPHTTEPPISKADKFLLKAYLDTPNDATLAAFLALVSLNKSLHSPAGKKTPGEALKHTVLAQYFLNRAKELGKTDKWISAQLENTHQDIDKLLAKAKTITSEEDHAAHKYFNETFNYHEENRYNALEALLNDFAEQPQNVYTSFTLTAANTWIGGEGHYDDPTVLQNFILGSYFSIHTMNLAKGLETAWLADKTKTPRFRMASILGGFSAINRRWLAKVHGQEHAIDAIDNEHREWRVINRAFHAFTVGLSFFEEEKNFQEGLVAWQEGFCQDIPSLRTCTNTARFAYNFEGYVLGYVDFLLKNGDVATASQVLQLRHVPEQYPYMEAYARWDLGRAAWEHREKNLNEISALYRNGNPADDPMQYLMTKRKWGADTATCQTCHQAQSSVFTEEQKNTVTLPPEQVATVGNWPEVRTTWYGTLPKIAAN